MQKDCSESCECGNIQVDMAGYNRDNPKGYRYFVQLGTFRTYEKAMELQLDFMKTGWTSVIKKQGNLFVVYTGDYSAMEDAVLLERILRFMGYQTMVAAME